MSNNPYRGAGYSGRNRGTSDGGPSGVQRSYASQLKEHEPLFTTYEHLQGLPRGDSALTMLRKVASMVKPIMRKHGWRVQILAEFLPPEQNLLGLNVNKGYKICIRLRYHNNPDLFLPIEQVVDTMLHELSHNVWGEHDSNFHKLWDELRDEYETLARKGYTGEGFLSEGRRLGGSNHHHHIPPAHEMRRLARISAEKRKAQGTLGQGSGQRLGGTPLHLYGGNVRQVIADQVARRNQINKGCASGRQDASRLSEQAAQNTFKTKAEEDDANNRAIAQALYELMEEEEAHKLDANFQGVPNQGGLGWSPEHGLYDSSNGLPPSSGTPNLPTEEEQMAWALRDSMNTSPAAPSADSTTLFNQSSRSVPANISATPPIPLASKPKLSASTERSLSPVLQRDRGFTDGAHNLQSSRDRSALTSQYSAAPKASPAEENLIDLSDETTDHGGAHDQWTCSVCTCINPMQFLACDACGVERPQSAMSKAKSRSPVPPRSTTQSRDKPSSSWIITPRAQPETMGWVCSQCGAFMEHKWWTCSACGLMKSSS